MIVQAPNSILFKKAERIDSAYARSPEFKVLLKKMYNAMIEARGIGIAAPQIGVSKQVAIIHPHYLTPHYEHLHVLINPSYRALGRNIITSKEGCLSVDEGKSGAPVPRYSVIELTNEILSTEGVLKQEGFKLGGFLARIVQHEVQHLHGILCIDMKLDV